MSVSFARLHAGAVFFASISTATITAAAATYVRVGVYARESSLCMQPMFTRFCCCAFNAARLLHHIRTAYISLFFLTYTFAISLGQRRLHPLIDQQPFVRRATKFAMFASFSLSFIKMHWKSSNAPSLVKNTPEFVNFIKTYRSSKEAPEIMELNIEWNRLFQTTAFWCLYQVSSLSNSFTIGKNASFQALNYLLESLLIDKNWSNFDFWNWPP